MSTTTPLTIAPAASFAIVAPGPPETAAELVRRLGDIPLERIRMQPAPGSATVADVDECRAKQNCLCELVDGVLVEKAVGYRQSLVAGCVLAALQNYNKARKLGKVTPADGMMQIAADLVRMPDVGFVFWNRFPDGRVPQEAAPRIAPDVAVEVLSPANTRREMERKRAEYFAAGTQVIWMIDIDERTVTVYQAPERFSVLRENEFLDGGSTLPGFRLSLHELFAELDEHGPTKPPST
jgi:Uma2 family endonuclease